MRGRPWKTQATLAVEKALSRRSLPPGTGRPTTGAPRAGEPANPTARPPPPAAAAPLPRLREPPPTCGGGPAELAPWEEPLGRPGDAAGGGKLPVADRVRGAPAPPRAAAAARREGRSPNVECWSGSRDSCESRGSTGARRDGR